MSRFSSLKSAISERSAPAQTEQATSPAEARADDIVAPTRHDAAKSDAGMEAKASSHLPSSGQQQARSSSDHVARSSGRSKVTRDGFSIPVDEIDVINELQSSYFDVRRKIVNRSMIIRAGLKALASLPPEAAASIIDTLSVPRRGRPVD